MPSMRERWAIAGSTVVVGMLLGCSATPNPRGEATSTPTVAPSEEAPTPSASAPTDETGPSGFETRAHDGAGLAFDVAQGWELSGQARDLMLASSPDGGAVIMFHIAEPDQLEAALAAIRSTLAREVKDIYFGPNKQHELNGLTAEHATGAGKLAGRPVELGQLLVATPTQKVLVVVAVIEAAAPATAKRQARHTLESIRPQPAPSE